jgi:beta-glucosidase-like glycosyl hydrolase/CubicO group peptidase (beta-lactamase class C family)
MVRRLFWISFLLILTASGLFANNTSTFLVTNIPDSCWADSVLNSLNQEQRIAQLIFARANKDNVFLPEIPDLIRNYNIGGVVFFKSTPVREANITNFYQSIAKTPLFVTMDAERGLAMRLDSTFGFPYMMTVGAISNDSLVYQMGVKIGEHCKRMGIQMNFAPVVDINSNPKNPVINMRSFGQDRMNVTNKASAYLDGMRKSGVLGTIKHFPGHGDTDSDSHYTLPVVNHPRVVLDSVDLFPFKQLIRKNADGVMVAHLFVPALDKQSNLASTLSYPIITQTLKTELNFNGFVITDALEMGGVTNTFKPGEICVKALLAGNDILLMPQNIPQVLKILKEAVDSCIIWPEDIDARCLKVLKYKQKVGLDKYKPIEIKNLYNDLNKRENEVLGRKIYSEALTLVKNDSALLPVRDFERLKIACLVIGDTNVHPFQQMISNYVGVKTLNLPSNPSLNLIDSVLLQLKEFNLVISAVTNTSILADKGFGINSDAAELIRCIAEQQNEIFVLFGNPYALARHPALRSPASILVCYQDNPNTWSMAAEAIMGAIGITGRLPVDAGNVFKLNTSIKNLPNGRLKYVIPEEAGASYQLLQKVDSLVNLGLSEHAFPGCQVFAAWKGNVILNKAYGYTDYSGKRPVRTSDLYDLASLTKVAATTLAVMKLTEEGKINIEERLGTYLPLLKNTNKEDLIIKDVMTHQARLTPWIPFYKTTLKSYGPDTLLYQKSFSEDFPIRVSDSLFLRKDYKDSLYQYIAKSPLEPHTRYLYSDLGFILLKEIVEKVSGKTFQFYLDENFYIPLGLSTLTFNPLQKSKSINIIPTENDTIFRKQLIRGYVHDPAAAMLGGISGHAGLFSNANDLGIILQMLINGGAYAGKQYLKKETIDSFTSVQFPWNDNRRGLGWDRPLHTYNENGPNCASASQKSFGHSGFTGTYIWADPQNELTFVFLSNRVNPDASNTKLAKMNLRTKIHELFYKGIRQ